MGQDKAGLMIEGMPLWRRQLATLQATGASEILISGRVDGPYAESGFPIIEDFEPGLGPLAGIVAAGAFAHHQFILVLAIDLPRMSSTYLRGLLSRGPVVPQRGERFEPLAAIYSDACLSAFKKGVDKRRLSLQSVIRNLVADGILSIVEVSAEDETLFANLNTPEDVAKFTRAEC
jgi:molybdenum cofactor guanylyltransferase